MPKRTTARAARPVHTARFALLAAAALCAVVVPFLSAQSLAQDSNTHHESATTRMDTSSLYPELGSYLAERATEFDRIDAERKQLLDALAQQVTETIAAGRKPRMNFVCTHNSRRSHMSQLWAQAAGEAMGLDLSTYSGGTEATAFNPRAVSALERAGFAIDKTNDDTNPIYHVRLGQDLAPTTCFSKIYDNAPNPKDAFIAVMVCNDADEKCPYVPGADARFAIPFVDPKVSDNTKDEAKTYDERCAQIAREFLYVMSKVRS